MSRGKGLARPPKEVISKGLTSSPLLEISAMEENKIEEETNEGRIWKREPVGLQVQW